MTQVPLYFVNNIYKSRKTLLEQFKTRGIDIQHLDKITEQETKLMLANKDIDFEIKQDHKKWSIKYLITPKLRNTTLRQQIMSFMEEEKIIDEDGNKNTEQNMENYELIFIVKENPNESLIKVIDEMYNEYKLYINIFWLNTLLFNILEHEYVPTHVKITNEEFKDIKKVYNLASKQQLPLISRHDPIAKILGIRPGEIVKIIRPSPACGKYITYRCCK